MVDFSFSRRISSLIFCMLLLKAPCISIVHMPAPTKSESKTQTSTKQTQNNSSVRNRKGPVWKGWNIYSTLLLPHVWRHIFLSLPYIAFVSPVCPKPRPIRSLKNAGPRTSQNKTFDTPGTFASYKILLSKLRVAS